MCGNRNIFVVFLFILTFLFQNFIFSDTQNDSTNSRYIINKVYSDDYLKEIAFPLGGFGAGQVYIRGNGRISPWEIMNNFNSNANVSDAFFSIYTENGEQSRACILQKYPNLPGEGVNKINFTGEFPFAKLDFGNISPDFDLSLECFSPFIPLEEKNSSLPAVFFTFTIKNNGLKTVKGSIAGTIPNLIGWDGYGELISSPQIKNGKTIHKIRHPDLGYNINTIKKETGTISIDMVLPQQEGRNLKKKFIFLPIYTNAHIRYDI